MSHLANIVEIIVLIIIWNIDKAIFNFILLCIFKMSRNSNPKTRKPRSSKSYVGTIKYLLSWINFGMNSRPLYTTNRHIYKSIQYILNEKYTLLDQSTYKKCKMCEV